MSTKYICYTQSVKDSLLNIAHDENALVVDNNTLYNCWLINPSEKKGNEKGILFIGRLRPRCGIDMLIEVLNESRKQLDMDIELHIIGGGPLSEKVIENLPNNSWIKYHGMVYDDKKISEISRSCRFGCYPTDMGLSVVHMMSLSLPVLTHGEMNEHMGPEPSYIKHNVNGWLYYPRNDKYSLSNSIRMIYEIPTSTIQKMQKNAYDTYIQLSTPPFHIRMLRITGSISN